MRSWSNKNILIDKFDSDWYASALLACDPESRFKINKLKIGLSEIYESKKNATFRRFSGRYSFESGRPPQSS